MRGANGEGLVRAWNLALPRSGMSNRDDKVTDEISSTLFAWRKYRPRPDTSFALDGDYPVAIMPDYSNW